MSSTQTPIRLSSYRLTTEFLLSKTAERVGMVLILLWGAWLRLFNLTELGLEHDEVANWLIDRAILNGKHGIYFSEAYGHEAGFHYLQTLFVALLGDHAFALRLPAALLGIVLIAVSYTLVKVLYNRPIALITALLLAITFFPIFYSRLALRAIMLPVLSGLAAYFFWKAEQNIIDTEYRIPNTEYLLAALFAGLSTYTYMASRVVPIFFAGWWLLSSVQWVRKRSFEQRRHPFNREWLIFWGVYVLIAAPLFIYLQRNPAAEFRVTEINAPLEAARNGDLSLIWQNAKLIFGVWGWSGDPLWRQNVAGTPIFIPLTAVLFYSGLGLMIWQRKRADLFCLLWIASATLPSLVTADAPSTIRMINMLPVLGVPFTRVIHTLSTISPEKDKLSTGYLQNWWITCLIIAAVWGSWTSFLMIQRVWPNGGDVPFVWQSALTDAARWLDTQTPQPTTIIGWTPDTMDAPTMELTMRNDDVPLRFASPNAVVLPAGEQVRVIRPKILDLPPALDAQLTAWDATTLQLEQFAVYSIRWTSEHLIDPLNIPFDDELVLLGHGDCPQPDQWCETATVWRINAPIREPRSVFIHLTNTAGDIVSQSDVRLAGAHSWRAGDLLFVTHQLNAADDTIAWVGAYHSETWQRLQTGGADSAEIDLIR